MIHTYTIGFDRDHDNVFNFIARSEEEAKTRLNLMAAEFDCTATLMETHTDGRVRLVAEWFPQWLRQ